MPYTCSMIKTLVLVGCGHMGHAMLVPWVKARAAENIFVVTPRLESLSGLEARGVTHVPFPQNLPPHVQPDVVVFAVKPQIAADVVPAYRSFSGALFLSVIAGKKLGFYETLLDEKARLIRAMPNLPAKVGKGATLLAAGAHATESDKQNAQKLLGSLGMASWLPDENMMDAATALSGCGPAYFYLLADVLGSAGVQCGLPADLAAQLARQTLLGSAALWDAQNESAAMLYQSIAVKGGMTEAALAVLQDNNQLQELMRKALDTAIERAKKLAGS